MGPTESAQHATPYGSVRDLSSYQELASTRRIHDVGA